MYLFEKIHEAIHLGSVHFILCMTSLNFEIKDRVRKKMEVGKNVHICTFGSVA